MDHRTDIPAPSVHLRVHHGFYRGQEFSLHGLPGEVNDHDIVHSQVVVASAAGGDGHQSILPFPAEAQAHIARAPRHQSPGQYLLAGLETGARTVLVSAQGYQPASQTVSLSQAGVEQTLDFTLSQ